MTESHGGRLTPDRVETPVRKAATGREDELTRQQMKPSSRSRHISGPQSSVSMRVFANYLPALSISRQSSFVYSVNIAKWPSTDVRHGRRCFAWKAFLRNCWHPRPQRRTYLFSTVVLMEDFTLAAECLRSGLSSAVLSGSAMKHRRKLGSSIQNAP